MQSPQNEEGSVPVPVDRRAIQLRVGAIFFFFLTKRVSLEKNTLAMNERWTHRVPTKCKLVLLTHQLLRQWNTPHRRRLLRHFRRLCHFPHPVLLCSNVPTVTLRQPESFDEHAWKSTKKKNHCVWKSGPDEMWIWKTRTNWSRLNFRVISLKINFRLKGETPNSHQLKGWFLIRGKGILSVEKKNLSEITATTTLLPVKGGVELYDWDGVDIIANCFLQGIEAFCCSAEWIWVLHKCTWRCSHIVKVLITGKRR